MRIGIDTHVLRKSDMRRRRKTRGRPVEIYKNVEAILARKGRNSLWPNKPFRHNFGKGASVLGVTKGGSYRLRKGDLIIRSRKGKKLWKMFEY